MTELIVTVFDEPCGRILQNDGALEYEFEYEPTWRTNARHGLSLSMPRGVVAEPAIARAYFGGLLPEGAARRHISQASQIDELDDVGLLHLLGEECPGAVRVYTPARFVEREFEGVDARPGRHIVWLDAEGEAHLLDLLRIPSHAAAIDRYSISLAGAQLKRGVRIDQRAGGDGLVIGLSSGPDRSTHILKLAVPTFEGIVQNEHATQALAAAAGIRASATSVAQVAGEAVLIVQRYDRVLRDDGRADPLHQEDMCQALGRLSSQKYERFDPRSGTAVGPTLADIVTLLRANVRPSIQQVDELLRMFWFNIAVGNVDAHAKNYSLLYRHDLEGLEMAPLYDSICITAHHDESMETRRAAEPLVMHVGGCTRFWQLERSHVERFARELNIQPSYVVAQVRKLVERVDAALDDVLDSCQEDPTCAHPVLDVVRTEIRARCAFLRDMLCAGRPRP